MNNITTVIKQADGIFLDTLSVNTAQYVILKEVLHFMNTTDFGGIEIIVNKVVDSKTGERTKKVDVIPAQKTRFEWSY
jgi:hypothetical protein